eukprot:COSAG05_NODE_10571_length_558_cov_0.886710_3_plen_20_part_01
MKTQRLYLVDADGEVVEMDT